MLNTEPLWRAYERIGYGFIMLGWLMLGGFAALWWVPSALGAAQPMTWQFGATCLFMQVVSVFNQWPRVGTRRFFQARHVKVEVVLLFLVSISFAAGFAFAA